MKNNFLIIFAIIVLLAIAGLVWFKIELKEALFKFSQRVDNAIYAVHLNNGQIYFGDVRSITSETIVLGNTHILQAIQTQIAPLATSTSFRLQQVNNQQIIYGISKRSEINKAMPTDNILFIDRHNVLFWEKLDNNSEIVKLFGVEKGK